MTTLDYLMYWKPKRKRTFPGPIPMDYYLPIPRIVCKDGFNVSVQAGDVNYSIPREDEGPWTAVELGYPSAMEESIIELAEDPEDPTATVYGYVPIEVVDYIIYKHGGIVLTDEMA